MSDAVVIKMPKRRKPPKPRRPKSLRGAASQGDAQILTKLLARGNYNRFVIQRALNAALLCGQHEAVSILINAGADINFKDDYECPLAIAVDSQCYETVEFALKLGANVHVKNDQAFSYAARRGNIKIARLLLAHGADVTGIRGDSLLKAAEGRSLEMVRFLVENGADIHDWGATFGLMEAIAYGEKEIAFFLLESGVDLHARGDAAVTKALYHGDYDWLKLFLDRGCDVNVSEGEALINAALWSEPRFVKLLLDYGADVRAQDDEALKNAAAGGRFEIVKMLLERGALHHKEAMELAEGNGHKEVGKLIKGYEGKRRPYVFVRK